MKFISVPELASTNTYLASIADKSEPYTVVVADRQTAGRGQRGNSWEAEPGKNLTFSVLLKPDHVKAADQFIISQAVSVAIAVTLSKRIRYAGEVAVKWPNDIYVDNQKICGILIENSLMGDKISRSIVGVGLNVNQKVFTSGAPNPVSLIHIIGEPTDRFALLKDVCAAIERHVEAIANPEKREEIVEMYKSILWRSDGMYKYAIPGGETFMATIEDISPAGYLFLRDDKGEIRKFAFKEVQYIL